MVKELDRKQLILVQLWLILKLTWLVLLYQSISS